MTRIPASLYFAIALAALLLALWTGMTLLQGSDLSVGIWAFWTVVFGIIAVIAGALAIISWLYSAGPTGDPLTRTTPSAAPKGARLNSLLTPADNKLRGAGEAPKRSPGRTIAPGGY